MSGDTFGLDSRILNVYVHCYLSLTRCTTRLSHVLFVLCPYCVRLALAWSVDFWAISIVLTSGERRGVLFIIILQNLATF
jgi:hypothetical protein